jgi:hypothetical protein
MISLMQKDHNQAKKISSRVFWHFLVQCMVTYRAFIHSGSRLTRGISNQEFVNATEELKPFYGQTLNLRVARASKRTHVFVKKAPNQILEWPGDILCTKSQFDENYQRPCHKSISTSIRQLLVNQNLLAQEHLH